jgi:hypothetical protein
MKITVKFNIPGFLGFRSVEAEEQFLEEIATAASENGFIQGRAVEADIVSIETDVRAQHVRKCAPEGGSVPVGWKP